MGGVVLRKDLGHGGRIELERLCPEAVGFLRVIHRLLMKGLLGQFPGLGVGFRIAFRRVLRSSHHALPWQAVRSTPVVHITPAALGGELRCRLL